MRRRFGAGVQLVSGRRIEHDRLYAALPVDRDALLAAGHDELELLRELGVAQCVPGIVLRVRYRFQPGVSLP